MSLRVVGVMLMKVSRLLTVDDVWHPGSLETDTPVQWKPVKEISFNPDCYESKCLRRLNADRHDIQMWDMLVWK